MTARLISSKKTVLFLGICLGIVVAILWSSQPAAQAQKGTTDLKTLKNSFAGNQVVVHFLNNNPQPAEGQLAEVMEIFGRRYLRITTNAGKNWLIDVERIVAIRQP